MQTPLQITDNGTDYSDALENHIRDRFEKLEEFFDRITSCRVVVELPHEHHQQ